MKIKKNLISMLMMIMVVTVLFVGQASAAGEGTAAPTSDSEQEVTYTAFNLQPTSGGTYVYATSAASEKVATGSAYYNITNIRNSTNYELYLNVAPYSVKDTVGSEVKIEKSVTSGTYYVSYSDSNGYIGTAYRPAARTSTSATSNAVINGHWRP